MKWEDLTQLQKDVLVAKHVFGYDPIVAVSRNYSTDATDADAMEDEIARQGLAVRYVEALAHVTGASRIEAVHDATPDQRCLAALRAKGVTI